MKSLLDQLLVMALIAPIVPTGAFGQTNVSLILQSTFKAHDLKGESLIQVQYSPTSQQFITVASDGKAKVWRKPAQEIVQFSHQPPAMLFNGRVEPDNSTLVTAAYNGIATRWSIKGAAPQNYGPHLSGVTDVELLPNGQGLVTTSDDGSIRLWTNDGELLKRVEKPGVSRHLALARNRQLIAVSQDISTITLLNTQGDVLQTFEAGQGRLNDVIFSPNEQLLLTTGFDGTIKIWDLSDLQKAPRLNRTIKASQTGWVNGLSLNKNGILASVGDDGTVRLWDLQGNELTRIQLGKQHILSCSFSPDGEKLLVAINDGTIAEYKVHR